ncbi:hypothetical protein EVAR_82582_1 [Eumeta japonica]|uniref:Uncharacterized protein n=1 Tax=Eumeta variegata TaxID=151549 RepID=A0A4C1UX79_EUMVA|nr:hypothetical protein EVAR_82582_1 [Eumeta japonica]
MLDSGFKHHSKERERYTSNRHTKENTSSTASPVSVTAPACAAGEPQAVRWIVSRSGRPRASRPSPAPKCRSDNLDMLTRCYRTAERRDVGKPTPQRLQSI